MTDASIREHMARDSFTRALSVFVNDNECERVLTVGQAHGEESLARTHLRAATIELEEASEMLILSRRAFRDVVEAEDRQRILERDNFLYHHLPVDMSSLPPIIHHRFANLFWKQSEPYRHHFCTAGASYQPTRANPD